MVRSKIDELAVDRGCYFDLAQADRVREFFHRFLRLTQGGYAGKRFELLDWEWERLIKPLYGWRAADGLRRFRQCGCWIAKKNGKSAMCSGLGLFHTIGDGEPGAEVYIAAADRDQASIVFNAAAAMAERSPHIAPHVDVVPSTKHLVHRASGSVLKALSAEVPTKEGLNWSALIFDEVHAQPSRKLHDTLKYGGIARRQPLLIEISTAGFDKTTIGWERYRYACGVRDGVIADTSFLPVIYEAIDGCALTDEEAWKAANPSLGHTITLDSFQADAIEASQNPRLEAAFRRYRLNQWTAQETRWIPVDKWLALPLCAYDALRGMMCYGGLDLSSVSDVTSYALWFPDAASLLTFHWMPSETIAKRRREGRVPFDEWARDGHVRAIPGPVIRQDSVRQFINTTSEVFALKCVAIDRWNSTDMQAGLKDDGIEVAQFGQGYASMTAPSKEFERRVLEGGMSRDGNQVMDWMVSVVACEQDPAGNLKPSKKRSTEKIDGVVAAIMAMGQWMLESKKKSPYDERGVSFV